MNQIVSIQALRAFAALAVAYGHAAHDAMQIAQRQGRVIDPAFRELSAAGVDLFFVISGFVMVWSSRGLFGQDGAATRFMARRLARIVPLYWATTTLFLCVMLVVPGALNSAPPLVGEIIKSYLFVPFRRLDDGLVQPVYRLGWTLNYEMFFYACFAALLWLRAGLAVAALTIGFGVLVVIGHLLKPVDAMLAFWTSPLLLEFVFGALIGMAYLKGFRHGVVPALLLVFVAMLWLLGTNGTALPASALDRLWQIGIPAALLFAAFALMDERRASGMATAWLAALGDASYALYLIHPMVIRALGVVWSRAGLGDAGGGWPFILAALGVSVLASLMVHRLFERPVTAWLQRR